MFFDKITNRLKALSTGLDTIDPASIARRVINSIADGMKTSEIDSMAADICASLSTESIQYETLATRILVSDMHKTLDTCFSDNFIKLYNKGLVSEACVKNFQISMDSFIDHDRDLLLSYFGIKTLQKGYLLEGETPQYMFMRVALALNGSDIDAVKETYNLLSLLKYTHATPTLFNAGTPRPQMSSCFLQALKEDSIDGIYGTITDCAQISKWSGGIGVHISNVRSKGSKIRGTNGTSDGIIPMCRVFNATARYVNQGGKRKGSIAVYLEPWHADIKEFLDLRLNQGDEEARCRDLFTALWIPDLFMKSVKADGDWYLMCPDESKGLQDVYGPDFDSLYLSYIEKGLYRERLKARQVWNAILKSQVETGTPYMLYKDSVNTKNNQSHLGTIKSSNLCAEIVQYSSPEETAVCNLASICLPRFITNGRFDFEHLEKVAGTVTKNLNRVIDLNYYPIQEALESNIRHRPIAIGVQGLADVFMMLNLPFDCKAARDLNKRIFSTIYTGALRAACQLAQRDGPYPSYNTGSPASRGILYPDMNATAFDPPGLRDEIAKYGLRNSLLVAVMPTASTSQIMGNNECVEPYQSNLFLRRTLAGEFVIVNRHLVERLVKEDKWNPKIKNEIIRNGGSVQTLDVSDEIKNVFRTIWEIPQKSLIDMAADRAPFVDQSQSMNLFVSDPTPDRLSSMHFYAWQKGLKTGMYYLRTRPKARAIQITCTEEVCTACQ
jgi:ribonucleoside-diphosphate reductase alpha chain/ribonucleoside-diphosphate reductase subunit M1